jgi:hypothetical protein
MKKQVKRRQLVGGERKGKGIEEERVDTRLQGQGKENV